MKYLRIRNSDTNGRKQICLGLSQLRYLAYTYPNESIQADLKKCVETVEASSKQWNLAIEEPFYSELEQTIAENEVYLKCWCNKPQCTRERSYDRSFYCDKEDEE